MTLSQDLLSGSVPLAVLALSDIGLGTVKSYCNGTSWDINITALKKYTVKTLKNNNEPLKNSETHAKVDSRTFREPQERLRS